MLFCWVIYFMYKSLSLVFLIILLPAVNLSCVSVPSQTQLISAQDRGLDNTVSAACRVDRIQASLQSKLEPARQLDSGKISMINWNIYKAQRQNWSEDFTALINEQDLLLLQEATVSPLITGLIEKQHTYWNLNTAFHYDGFEAGVLTASAIKPLFSCGLRTTEPFIRIPKTSLVSLYPIAGSDKKLLVANLHGINFTLGVGVYGEQIRDLVEIVNQHSGPVIVAGDFNTWSEQRMDVVKNMANQLSMQAVTYKIHNRVRVFGNALDHVFYRGLEVTSENILKVTSSDHNPIKVIFRLPESMQQLTLR